MNETLAALAGATLAALVTMFLSLRAAELMKRQHQHILLRSKRIEREISLLADDEPFALQQRLGALAAVAPRAAVLEGWRAVEHALQEVAAQGTEQLIEGADVIRLLPALSLASPELAKRLLTLREMRNRALYTRDDLSHADVEPFLPLAVEIVRQLKGQNAQTF